MAAVAVHSKVEFRPAKFKSKEFDQYVEDRLKEWKIPGLAIAIVDGDQTLVKNFGFADLEDHRPIDEQTIFDCASTSKAFTAAAVALVLEDDQKSKGDNEAQRTFTTPVSKFLPDDFVMSEEYYTQNVTVEDILSHRSGMPRYDDSYFGANAKEQDTPRSVTRNLRNLPPTKPLRTTYQYCNMMYTVATHLVSALSGASFSNFIQDRMWEPLGMKNTYLNVPGTEMFADLKSRMATGYYWAEKDDSFKSVPFYDQSEAIGAGSVFSSVSDYAKFIRCMLTKSAPLSEDSHEELVKPRIISEPDKAPKHGRSHILYALGWEIQHYRGHHLIGHDGCVWGFNSTMKFAPDLDWGIVIFNNGDEGAAQCNDIIESILIDDLIGVPVEQRLDWNAAIREQYEKDKVEWKENEAKEDETDEEDVKDSADAKELPLRTYAGYYYNKGYRSLRLRLQDNMLTADCTDRSFPFHLDVRRKRNNHFVCKLRDPYGGDDTSIKVKFQIGERSGQPVRFGINLESEMDGELVWFDKVTDDHNAP